MEVEADGESLGDSFSGETEEVQVQNPVVELEKFREQWKLELGLQPVSSPSDPETVLRTPTASANLNTSSKGNQQLLPIDNKGMTQDKDVFNSNNEPISPENILDEDDEEDDRDRKGVEDEAHELFLQAVQFEKTGNFFEAIRFYKKALALVPDIEHRVCQHQQQQQLEKEKRRSLLKEKMARLKTTHGKKVGAVDNGDVDEDDDGNDEIDLTIKFLNEIKQNNWLWFEKFKSDDKPHLQQCPEEVVKYILRWIVSTDLDVRSLDTLSNVSKGFYVLCRDEKLWKDICERIWGHVSTNTGRQSDFSSYRDMFLTRSRVRFDGCYISKITYIRSGENSFQDSSYRPWHIVEYYRYIYFTPQGQFFFLTTSEIPTNTIPHLRDPTNQTKFNNILIGHYTLEGDMIHGQCWNPSKIKVNNVRNNNSGFGNVSYNLVLQVLHLKKKFNNGLLWVEYFVNIESNNHILKNDFTIEQLKFPNFFYSRVKSFTRGARSILG